MTDIKLIQSKASDDELKFGMFYPCATVSGTAQLVQEFAAEFASAILPGFDRGTGLLENLDGVNAVDKSSAESIAAESLSTATQRILARQSSQTLRASERLSAAYLKEVQQVSVTGWKISIDLVTAAGDTVEFVI